MDLLKTLGLDRSILLQSNDEIVKQLRRVHGDCNDIQLLFDVMIKVIKVISTMQNDSDVYDAKTNNINNNKHTENVEFGMESDIGDNLSDNESVIYQLSEDENDEHLYDYLQSSPTTIYPVPFNFTSNYKPKSSLNVKVPANISNGEKTSKSLTIQNWDDLTISKISMLYNVSKGIVGPTLQVLRDFEKIAKEKNNKRNITKLVANDKHVKKKAKKRRIERGTSVTPPYTTIHKTSEHENDGNVNVNVNVISKQNPSESLKGKSLTKARTKFKSKSKGKKNNDLFKSVHNISMRNMLINEVPSKPIDFSYSLTDNDMYECQCGELFNKYLDLYKHKVNRLC